MRLMFGGYYNGRPVPFGVYFVSFLPSSTFLSSMSMSTKFSGVKKFCVGTDVIGWDLGVLFSLVIFLFFRFLL